MRVSISGTRSGMEWAAAQLVFLFDVSRVHHRAYGRTKLERPVEMIPRGSGHSSYTQ